MFDPIHSLHSMVQEKLHGDGSLVNSTTPDWTKCILCMEDSAAMYYAQVGAISVVSNATMRVLNVYDPVIVVRLLNAAHSGLELKYSLATFSDHHDPH